MPTTDNTGGFWGGLLADTLGTAGQLASRAGVDWFASVLDYQPTTNPATANPLTVPEQETNTGAVPGSPRDNPWLAWGAASGPIQTTNTTQTQPGTPELFGLDRRAVYAVGGTLGVVALLWVVLR